MFNSFSKDLLSIPVGLTSNWIAISGWRITAALLSDCQQAATPNAKCLFTRGRRIRRDTWPDQEIYREARSCHPLGDNSCVVPVKRLTRTGTSFPWTPRSRSYRHGVGHTK